MLREQKPKKAGIINDDAKTKQAKHGERNARSQPLGDCRTADIHIGSFENNHLLKPPSFYSFLNELPEHVFGFGIGTKISEGKCLSGRKAVYYVT